jgi:hypothetical protein
MFGIKTSEGRRVSWNEQKGRRFEELRKRGYALPDDERTELAVLTSELEGVETSYMDEKTKRKMLSPVEEPSTSIRVPTRFRAPAFCGGVSLAFLCTFGAYVFAMGAALSWPLSAPNMEYAISQGVFWGVVGGLLVGFVASSMASNARACLALIGVGSVVWAGASSFVFFVYVAGTAGC